MHSILLLVGLAIQAAEPGERPPDLQWIATEHLGRLTDTKLDPLAAIGLTGTDLGVSFEAGDQLVFLFGDSWTIDGKERNDDSVATIRRAPLPEVGLPRLAWAKRENGRFLPLAPAGVRLGGMNVPVEGLAVGAKTYVFFDAGWDDKAKRHRRSLLAHTTKLDFGAL